MHNNIDDEGNDELMYVRSDETCVFMISSLAKFLGKLIPEAGCSVCDRKSGC